eukprot:g21904.t1
MCGILGIVAEPGRPTALDDSQILAMRDTMRMRGPDDAGLFTARNVAFAHRRLAIRDLDSGAQPWQSSDGRTVLVYNGELYNDAELREELRRLGQSFRTRCDTEVVMAAYRQWGTECVEHFRGMFALGVYDFRDESLFLARDRFGIKPLYLMSLDGTLVFASAISALVAHPRFSRRPNWPAISHYLTTFRTTLGRLTLYDGLHQLLPGERLHWKSGRIRIDRYWDYPAEATSPPDYESAVAEFRDRLREAVRIRLVSDVPVGMFLSGGVDSSTIACMMHELQPGVRIAGRCGGGRVAARDGSDDDFLFARQCAEFANFDFEEVRVGADEYWDCWNWMLDEYTTPLSTPTDVILYRLAQATKESVGVVLGGEGADELLCGYAAPHWAGNDFDRLRTIEAGHWNDSKAAEFLSSMRRQYGRVRFADRVEHFLASNSLIPVESKVRLLQPWIWNETDEDAPIRDAYSVWLNSANDDPRDQRTAIQQMQTLHRVNLEGLLNRLDSATMLAGLEARVPFTDHELVESVFRLPQRYRIDVAHDEPKPYLASAALEQRGSLRSKRLLRSVAEGMMPAALAQRKKASFPTPVERWLSGDWSQRVRDRLLRSDFGRAMLRPDAVATLADNLPAAGLRLWPIVNLVAWGDRCVMIDETEWDRLIDGLRRGDNDAVAEFCRLFADRLERVADRHLMSGLKRRVGADDVVQSVCRTFVRRTQEGEFEISQADSLWALLCAITLTKVREQARFHLRQKRSLNRENNLDSMMADGRPRHEVIPGSSPNPAGDVEFADQLEQFQHEDEGGIAEFRLNDRWISTATNGSGGAGSIGSPIVVTWSIVRDGVFIQGFAGESASPSNLVGTFRGIYGIADNPADTNYQGEAWFEAIEDSFERWSEVSGVTYVYEANDDGASFASAAGALGVRGDVRIAGHTIDGNSGTLAYNFYPDTADMVIDTADGFYSNTSGNSLRLRNVVTHEAGHGLGLAHVSSSNASFLMEPFINLSFDGPQLDDILGVHRGYGDANESGGGNDTAANATGLGTITAGQSVTIGTDGPDTVVAANDVDFVSIDDDSDVDYFSFTVGAGSELDVILTPLGPSYLEGPQNGSQGNYNTSAFSNLTLQVIAPNGSTVVASANNTGLGGTESLSDLSLAAAGTYFVRVSGANNAVQLYELGLSVTQSQQNPGVTVTQTGDSTNVTEGGNSDTYSIVLDSQPTADVTISVNPDGELSTSLNSVTFTPQNWNQAQSISVSAINDTDVEGNHSGTITHSASSVDSSYHGISVANVSVGITDNDRNPGVTITQTNGSTSVTEGGNSDSYSIVLESQPIANVTIAISPDGELSTNPNSVTFTPQNWNVARSVTVVAVNDGDVEGNHSGTITHTVSSGDSNYNGISAASVSVSISDNDSYGVSITQSGGSTAVAEGGSGDNYTVVLNSQPASSVVVSISNADGELTTDATSITFTTANWSTPQTVSVGAVDDGDVEGNHSGTITHAVSSGDSNYHGISVAGVTASITDNDSSGETSTLYFSLQSSASAGGLQIQNEDIVAFDGESFSLLFDGSDVGLSRMAIDAFDMINETDILISFTNRSGSVDDSDVLLFRATSLGANTAGSFYWYFDASDVGLSSNGEDVDAVTLLDDGSLLLSTRGNGSVAGLSFRDEDVIRFTPGSLGSSTSGSFSMFLDGSDSHVGLSQNGGEDIDGLAVADGDLYLTTVGNFSVPGVAGADDDVFVYDVDTGTYASNLFVNFTSNDLTGLDFAGTVTTAGLGLTGGIGAMQADGDRIFAAINVSELSRPVDENVRFGDRWNQRPFQISGLSENRTDDLVDQEDLKQQRRESSPMWRSASTAHRLTFDRDDERTFDGIGRNADSSTEHSDDRALDTFVGQLFSQDELLDALLRADFDR